MTYKEFQNSLLSELKSRNLKDVDLQIQTSLKCNNQHKAGILFKKSDCMVSPQIYIEEYFSLFQSGNTIEEIADMILNTYQKLTISDIDVTKYYHLDSIKDRICMKLINTEMNREFLETVPHTPFEDLSVIYYYLEEIDDNGTQTMTIDNQKMKMWKTDIETLHRYALENTIKQLSISFSSMVQTLYRTGAEYDEKLDGTYKDYFSKVISTTPPDIMYILTNKFCSYGAALICYDDLMEQIAETFRGSFYIIPSSVHETILIPRLQEFSDQELTAMIQGVNQNVVAPEELLSDHVYYYSKEKRRVIGLTEANIGTNISEIEKCG